MAARRALAQNRVTPLGAVGLVLVASVLILGAALYSQYVVGLRPCVLCVYQRVPYVLVIAVCGLALAASLLGKEDGVSPVWMKAVLAVCAVAFLAGAGVAAFHVGVEQGWWVGTTSCGGADMSGATLEELRAHILNAPIVRCDETAWSLFGISMAGYNFLVSLVLAGSCLRLSRARNGAWARG